jgi:hypothetical protein
MDGKAKIVCVSWRICYELYETVRPIISRALARNELVEILGAAVL